jgi:regulator of protease activity HflC (stomatin/prohibitin superfamily)
MTFSMLLLISAGVLLALAIRRVPQGQAFTVHRFGEYRRTLTPGVHWIVPLVESVAHRMSLTGRAVRFPTVQLSREDTALRVGGGLWYQVIDPAQADPRADHLDDFVLESTHAALDDLAPWLSSLEGAEFNAAVKTAMNQRLRPHGLLVTRCELDHGAQL